MTKRSVQICGVFVLSVLFAIATPLAAQYAASRSPGVDSLERVLATDPPEGLQLVALYNTLSNGYRHKAEKRIEYARRCITAGEPLDSWELVADCYMQIGLAHDGETRYDSTLIYFNRALAAAERMRDFPKRFDQRTIDDLLASIYGNTGNLYNIQGLIHEATDYYLRALELFEKHGLMGHQANVYYNIGEMYLAMENYSQAEEYYLRTEDIAHQMGDSLFMAYVDGGLSIVEMERGNYDRALERALAAHAYYFAHPEEESFQVSVLNTLATICLNGPGDVDRAEEYVRQALGLIDTQEVWVVTQSATLGLLAEVHLARGEWRAARDAALQSLALDDLEFTNTLPAYKVLAKAYSHLGDTARADEYFDRHDSLQTTWATRNYQMAIREMETRYETEKKETRIATLEDERRLMVWLGIAAGAVLLLALATLFLLWRWTAGRRRISEQQIVQLEQEKQLVATQAVLDGELQERTRLARDLHDGLGSILAAAKYNFADIRKNGHKPLDMERYDTAVGLLDDSMREMRRVAHHLMPEALGTAGLRQSIADFCATVPHVKFSWYGDSERLDPNMEVIIYRIMHELVSNALNHSGAEHIIVQVVKEGGRISLTVQDDGRGFDPASPSPGMGLTNIRARVAALNGNLLVDSRPGGGTEINVEFFIDRAPAVANGGGSVLRGRQFQIV